jgi:hypothetical protein
MKPVALDSRQLLGFRITVGQSRHTHKLGGKISELPGKGGTSITQFSAEIGGKIGDGSGKSTRTSA